MLSYRHAFHAGNHADVLKHFVLMQLIQYLQQKDTSFHYIDTHAGAGLYALEGTYAAKNAEYETGISRLWNRKDLPVPLAEYLKLVKDLNADGKLRHYPGSPWIANAMLREQECPVEYDMQDLQNCLCEFDKYMRILHGTGRSKRGYPGV